MRFDWTADRIETARTMYQAGNTASEIAAVLNEGLDRQAVKATRSAVCGKLTRLGLYRAGPSAPTSRKAVRLASRPVRLLPRPKRAKAVKDASARAGTAGCPVDVLSPGPIALVDLPNNGACRWVVDVDAALMCANACGDATYCAGHHALAYEPARARYTPAQVDWVIKRAERNRDRAPEVLAAKPWAIALWGRRA